MRKVFLVKNPRYYDDPVVAVTETRAAAMELFAIISHDLREVNEDSEKYVVEVPLFVDAYGDFEVVDK